MKLELNLDDKEFMRYLADYCYAGIESHVKDESKDHWYMWYDKDIAGAVKQNVDKLFEENKDKLFNAIVDKCAELYHKDFQLRVILSAMANKED